MIGCSTVYVVYVSEWKVVRCGCLNLVETSPSRSREKWRGNRQSILRLASVVLPLFPTDKIMCINLVSCCNGYVTGRNLKAQHGPHPILSHHHWNFNSWFPSHYRLNFTLTRLWIAKSLPLKIWPMDWNASIGRKFHVPHLIKKSRRASFRSCHRKFHRYWRALSAKENHHFNRWIIC